MTPQEIKAITDKVKTPCLVGAVFFDRKLQQNVCLVSTNKCKCKEAYENALREEEEAKAFYCRHCLAMFPEECGCHQEED